MTSIPGSTTAGADPTPPQAPHATTLASPEDHAVNEPWKLPKSRALFFRATGESPKVSYWASEAVSNVIDDSMQVPEAALSWRPDLPDSRANCPELHAVMNQLIRQVAPSWRARTKNVYAGRTSRNEESAYSLPDLKAGMIAISQAFSIALAVYVSAFEKFILLADEASMPAADWITVRKGMRDELRDHIDTQSRSGVEAVRGRWFMSSSGPTGARAIEDHHRLAETWVITHELAHHIVRHSSSRQDKAVKAMLRGILAVPCILAETEGLSRAQLDEIEADVLATLIMSDKFSSEPGHPFHLFAAVNGAVFALLAVGHLDRSWTEARREEHPGALTRIAVVVKAMMLEFGDVPFEDDDPKGLSLPRVAARLAAFALWLEGSDTLFNRAISIGVDPRYALRFEIAHYSAFLAVMTPEGALPLFALQVEGFDD
ncbi:MAG: hypothetical protein ACYC90_05110 [Candidatus Nanopelagicales bacterium]